jgi:pyridoxine/pyridoxamine 5'-phosphate oxidase
LNISKDSKKNQCVYSAHDVFDVGDLVSREPFKQFTSWFDEASNAPDIGEPNAMALATATK